MALFLLTFGVATHSDLGAAAEADRAERLNALYKAAFSLGPAWQGGQLAVFLRCDLPIDQLVEKMLPAIEEPDLLMVVELSKGAQVRYAGQRWDDEGFDELFPHAVEVEHLRKWEPPPEPVLPPITEPTYDVHIRSVTHSKKNG